MHTLTPPPALPPPPPPAHRPVQLITISTNQKKQETKDRMGRREEGRQREGGKMLSLRNAIFCLQRKGGKRECQRKCQGPSLLPSFPLMAGVVSPSRPCWKGKHTHPLRISPLQPDSSQLGTFLLEDSVESARSTQKRTRRFPVDPGRNAATLFFLNDVLRQFCFNRQYTHTAGGVCV